MEIETRSGKPEKGTITMFRKLRKIYGDSEMLELDPEE